jgi:hypothetical protein
LGLATLAVTAAGACSGGPQGEGTGGQAGGGASHGGTIELSELCAAFVDDVCAVLMQCGGVGYCDLDHCRADQACLGMAVLEAEVASGWVEYDAAAAADCHDAFAAAPCDFGTFFSIPTVQDVFLRCPGVLTPKQAEGAECVSQAACTEGTQCVAESGCPGACVPWLTEDETCVIGEGPRCDPRIELECRDGVCKPPWAVGDPCSAAADCYPYWCDMMAGTCKPTANAGEACDNSGQVAPRCGDDLWCDSLFDVGVCQPLSSAAEPCFQDPHCQEPLTCLPDMGFPEPGVCGDSQSDGSACDSFADCKSGICDTDTCVAAAGEGEACSIGVECAEGLVCEQSVCRAGRCPGQACGGAQGPCIASLCKDSVCTTRAALGEPCAQDGDCASGRCDSGACVDPKTCLP